MRTTRPSANSRVYSPHRPPRTGCPVIQKQWWAIALMLTGTIALAAGQLPVAQLQSGRFNEVMRPEAPVAGDDIMGLTVDSGKPTVNATRLYVRRPADATSLVCIEISSRDGGYVASNTYILPASPPGSYVEIPVASPSPLGTSHIDLFKAASPQVLGVLARVDSCSARSDKLLPLAWGTPPDSGALRLIISVQSGRTSASLIVNESPPGQHACAPVTEGRRTAFDALCGLELTPSERRPVSLRVRRCAFDDCANSPLVYIDL